MLLNQKPIDAEPLVRKIFDEADVPSSEDVAIMFSGGIDSSLLADMFRKEGPSTRKVHLLAFDDDSVNFKTRRIIALEQVAQHLGLYDNLKLIRTYRSEDLRGNDTFGFIPGYKMAMQIACMAYCQKLGVRTLLMGYNKENVEYYPYTYKDELEENIQAIAKVYNMVYDANIVCTSPLHDLTKAEIVAVGHRISFPFEKTISCRETRFGGLVHCGTCLPCRSRIDGFREAMVADPTVYHTDKPFDLSTLRIGSAGTVGSRKNSPEQIINPAPTDRMVPRVQLADGSSNGIRVESDEELLEFMGADIPVSPSKPKHAAAELEDVDGPSSMWSDDDYGEDEDTHSNPKKRRKISKQDQADDEDDTQSIQQYKYSDPMTESDLAHKYKHGHNRINTKNEMAQLLYEKFAGSALGSKAFPEWREASSSTKRKWKIKALNRINDINQGDV